MADSRASVAIIVGAGGAGDGGGEQSDKIAAQAASGSHARVFGFIRIQSLRLPVLDGFSRTDVSLCGILSEVSQTGADSDLSKSAFLKNRPSESNGQFRRIFWHRWRVRGRKLELVLGVGSS